MFTRKSILTYGISCIVSTNDKRESIHAQLSLAPTKKMSPRKGFTTAIIVKPPIQSLKISDSTHYIFCHFLFHLLRPFKLAKGSNLAWKDSNFLPHQHLFIRKNANNHNKHLRQTTESRIMLSVRQTKAVGCVMMVGGH